MRNRIALGKIEREMEKLSPDKELKLLETYSSDKESGRERYERCKKGALLEQTLWSWQRVTERRRRSRIC
jgi:hypothetical protein